MEIDILNSLIYNKLNTLWVHGISIGMVLYIIPKSLVDIIEEDLSIKFDPSMGDSKLMGDALNKDKRNSQNVWVPTTHWLGGFMWHYIERANRENFLYDLRNIDDENMQYTQYGPGQFYTWHNDAGIAGAYKPQAANNRVGGREQDFVNENTELVRKLSFVLQLSDPDDYEGGNLQLFDEGGVLHILHQERGEP